MYENNPQRPVGEELVIQNEPEKWVPIGTYSLEKFRHLVIEAIGLKYKVIQFTTDKNQIIEMQIWEEGLLVEFLEEIAKLEPEMEV